MSWRDRDYARFSDEERRALFGGGRSHDAPGAGRLTHGASHRSASPAVLLAAGVSVVAVILGHQLLHIPIRLTTHAPTPVAPPPVRLTPSVAEHVPSVASPPGVVSIRWRLRDLAPAGSAGRICITVPAHGRVCASFAVGEKPADALARRIESLGVRVQSSG
jgi:hypothetical protein